MLVPLYRRNVYRTLSVKPAKAGLRQLVRKTKTTNVFHAAVGMATEAGELLEGMQQYILEGIMTPEAKDNAFEELGDFSYYTVGVLAKELKVKVPSATKKMKLVGTIGHGLLELDVLATAVLSLAKKNFYGVALKEHHENGEARMALDVEAQEAKELANQTQMALKVEQAITLFYQLVYAIFGESPDVVFAGTIAKLALRYPDGFFDTDAALSDKDTPAEVAKAKAAGDQVAQAKQSSGKATSKGGAVKAASAK